MKLLAVGDMHLGRHPSRIPQELTGLARDLGPSGAWARLVDYAIARSVDGVLFAGDLVEREEDFFEAYRELKQGMSRLSGAGIRIYGVAGNHDVRVLPRLAGQLPEFTLVGADGSWEGVDVIAGDERVTIWGRCFRERHETANPLAGVQFERRPGFNLGLLHCDRDQSNSPYAPVRSRDLELAGLDAWLLGHVHKPDPLSTESPFGYLGSITGMDPGETGDHGPWLLEIENRRLVSVEQWLLAPLRWERLDVDLYGVEEAEESRERLLQRVRQLDEELAKAAVPPQAAGLRVIFCGRSRFGSRAVALLSGGDGGSIFPGAAGTHYFLEQVESVCLPEVSLEQLAGRTDPPGLLARRLLLLERPVDDPERRRLLRETKTHLEKQARDARWARVRNPDIDDEQVIEWIRLAAAGLLDAMLEQAGESS